MSDGMSARLGLPLLAPGQAQKEMTHNEALAALELLVQASVVAVGGVAPPTAPASGQCWIVGDAATGAWAGRDGALAGWSDAGWRFATPFVGMRAWDEESNGFARYASAGWTTTAPLGDPGPAIDAPTGGTIADAEARAAVSSILMVLRDFGLITPA